MVNEIEILLLSSFPSGKNVTRQDFVDTLELSEQELGEAVELVHDAGNWASSYVVICREAFKLDFSDDADDMAPVYAEQKMYQQTAEWLDRRPIGSIRSGEDRGLSVTLMVRINMSQNQMDLKFPSQFVTSCSRLGLSLMIISNDF